MDKFMVVNQHFKAACLASKRHSEIVSGALSTYGDHGPQISGIVRDHFPDDVKEELRSLASFVTREMDMAYAARPKYVRVATLRKLARNAARAYGHGFYGPQP